LKYYISPPGIAPARHRPISIFTNWSLATAGENPSGRSCAQRIRDLRVRDEDPDQQKRKQKCSLEHAPPFPNPVDQCRSGIVAEGEAKAAVRM
jgi:hypothetical protein